MVVAPPPLWAVFHRRPAVLCLVLSSYCIPSELDYYYSRGLGWKQSLPLAGVSEQSRKCLVSRAGVSVREREDNAMMGKVTRC